MRIPTQEADDLLARITRGRRAEHSLADAYAIIPRMPAMRLIKVGSVRKCVREMGLRINPPALEFLNDEVRRLIRSVADVCKQDNRKTIRPEHFYLRQTLKSLARKLVR